MVEPISPVNMQTILVPLLKPRQCVSSQDRGVKDVLI